MQNQWQNQGPGSQPGPNGQRGPAPTNPYQGYWKWTWHIWGPFLIQVVIGMVVSSAASSVYTVLYHYKDLQQMMLQGNQGAMQELLLSVAEEVSRYSAQISGVAALVTIPIMLILFHMDRKKEKVQKIAQNKKAPIWKYLAVAGIAASLSLALNNLITIGGLIDMDSTYEASLKALYSAPFSTQLLCLAVLVPVAEELVFRGLVFKRFREQSGFMKSAVYSALMFGLIHDSMVQMLYGFAMGMMLAYVYEKYGSIKAPVLAHMIINTISVVGTKYKLSEWMMEDIMRIGLITVVCAAVAATMFVLIQRIEEKPELPSPGGEKENLAAM